MVTITSILSATAAANTQQQLVQLVEQLCKPYNSSSTIQPVSSVTFTVGAVTVEPVTSGETTTYSAIVPINVTGYITYTPYGKCNSITKLFAEKFTVAFTGLTANPTTFTITTGMQTKGSANVKRCNKAYAYNINTAVTITAA